MRVLALDTATRSTAVALCDVPVGSGLVLQARDDPRPGERPGHARHLLPLIASCVDEGGGWDRVDRIAVGLGPGTFTGLRIGVSAAHGLARARGCELVGIDTLRSVALGAALSGVKGPGDRSARTSGIAALLDARRGELFVAGWAAAADTSRDPPLIAPRAAPPEQVCAALRELGDGPIAVGDGAILFAEMLQSAGAIVPPRASAAHQVSAAVHCDLAALAVPGEIAAVIPQYLRVPDAELARERGR